MHMKHFHLFLQHLVSVEVRPEVNLAMSSENKNLVSQIKSHCGSN